MLHVQHDYFSLFKQSDHCFLSSSVIGSLIGWIKWIRKNNRAARAARFLLQFSDVVGQTTTGNFHICGSDANANLQQWIFHSLPLRESHSCQESESALRLFFTTLISTWNNRETLNLTLSSILNFKWRFRCHNRRSFLNSLIRNFNNIACSFKNSYWRVKGASDNLNSTEVWIST